MTDFYQSKLQSMRSGLVGNGGPAEPFEYKTITSLSPYRRSSPYVSPVECEIEEVSDMLKALRTASSNDIATKQSTANLVDLFVTKILSLFPDTFLFSLLQYRGTGETIRVNKTKTRHSLKISMEFDTSYLPATAHFDNLGKTFSHAAYTDISAKPQYYKSSSISDPAESTLSATSIKSGSISSDSRISATPISPPTSIASEPSANTRRSTDNPLPPLGVIYEDCSRSLERNKIVIENRLDREMPEEFTYTTHNPRPPDSENDQKLIQEMMRKKFSGIRQTCECDDFDESCTHCPCAKYYTVVSDGGSDSSNCADSDVVLKSVYLSEKNSNEIWECGAMCSCESSACMNRHVQRGNGRIQTELIVKKTLKLGFGLFAKYPVKKGTYIGPYTGEVILYNEEDSQFDLLDDSYFFESCLGEFGDKRCRLIIDSKKVGNVTRFINHSCDPNLRAFHVLGDNMQVPIIALFTSRPIRAGEQLFLDYTKSYWDEKNLRGIYCGCASSKCQYKDPNRQRQIKRPRRTRTTARKESKQVIEMIVDEKYPEVELQRQDSDVIMGSPEKLPIPHRDDTLYRFRNDCGSSNLASTSSNTRIPRPPGFNSGQGGKLILKRLISRNASPERVERPQTRLVGPPSPRRRILIRSPLRNKQNSKPK